MSSRCTGTLKPALPNMPAAAVMLAITPYVTSQELLHKLAQRLVMRSYQKVKVIRLREKANIFWVPCFC
jgi:hypothetical protein